MNYTSKTLIDKYRSKLITAEKAAQLVRNGYRLSYGTFNSKPVAFDIALANRITGGEITDLGVLITGTVPPIPQVVQKMAEKKNEGNFYFFSCYMGLIERIFQAQGVASYIPAQYFDGALVSQPGYPDLTPNMTVIQATSMDSKGNFNFGINNSYQRADILGSPVTIVEVNSNFPTVLGGYDESVNIDEIDYIIEGSNPELYCLPHADEPTADETKIAQHIIPLIKNGSCLQLGIGSIPNLIGKMIADSDLKDLGIHSEMFCDAIYDMYKAGKITNAKKQIDKYKSVFTFSLCTKETMEFLTNNPQLASYNSWYVTHHSTVAANDNMVAINSSLEMDIMGQTASEAVGSTQYSGTGGQLSFSLGANDSKGGVSILCFTSTYKDKKGNLHSKIKSSLTPGSVITVPRAAVDTVVTEYGAVKLRGLSLWKRTEAMINLAHPDFRDDLVAEAQKMNIWHKSNKIS